MYRITVASIPVPLETYKDRSPDQTGIWGAEVAKDGLFRSLLEHSMCDTVYVLCGSQRQLAESSDRLAAYPNSDRIEPILFSDYHRLSGEQRMVLFHPGSSGADGIRQPVLQGLVNLRGFIGGTRWPITGVTHSISGPPGFWFAFGALLETLRSYDALVCTSRAGRSAIERIMSVSATVARRKYGTSVAPKVQLPIIPLGTDATIYRPRDKALARMHTGLPREHVIFLYLGRFSSHHKMDLFPLILAFSRLPPERRVKATLILAGDDVQHRLSPRLMKFAAAVGISDRVVVVPNPTNDAKTRLYNAADVFVSPTDSVQETFGQSVIEAMASGLPVIAADWNGHRDTVRHGNTGFLVPTYWADCVDHLRRTPFLWDTLELYRQLGQAASVDMHVLTQHMDQMICDDSHRMQMGENSRQRALTTYNWPVIIQQYEALWSDLMVQAAQHRGESAHDDLSFDYLDVFRGHPTKLVTADSNVRISAVGAEIANDVSRLRLFEPTELSGNDDDVVMQVVAACRPNEKVTVAELVGRVSDSVPDLHRARFQQIAQLVKYGILELC